MAVEKLNPKITLEDFLEVEKDSDVILEYINGYIEAKSFSSMKHNKIVTRINGEVDRFLRKKPCEVFSEQIEVILGENRVKPDVFVVCKKDGKFSKVGQSFLTIPSLIFEVVSHSNASLDTITKMELYAKFGIREYNLVYQEGLVYQYVLNEFGSYYPVNSYKIDDKYESVAIDGLNIELEDIFENLDF